MPLPAAFIESDLPQWPVKRGKVRDIYDLGETLLFVATDRISAFDWILAPGIPDKGKILTQISKMWFEKLDQEQVLGIPHHVKTMDLTSLDLDAQTQSQLDGRSMIVHKSKVVPIECVARGYLAGSGWKEYQKNQSVCGVPLPSGLSESSKLPQPIFTPATKAEEGHDENISFSTMCKLIDPALAEKLKKLTLALYEYAADFAQSKGIIIADTKFEFGIYDGEIMLIDEVLTPDSSRFWPMEHYEPGRSQRSFDKQYVRDWLETQPWDKQSTPPRLPDEIVSKTRELYLDAYARLLGFPFSTSS